MGLKTEISWTDSTWSPLRVKVRDNAATIATAKGYASLVHIAEKMAGHIGPHCEAVSHGCTNCYSQTNNHRCLPANGTGLPFDRRSRDLIEPFVDRHILKQPFGWRRPRRVFVENQSDLFGEWVTDEMIDEVFAVMVLTPNIDYQILTKRAARLAEYLKEARAVPGLPGVTEFTGTQARVFHQMVGMLKSVNGHALNRASDYMERRFPNGDGFMRQWPLPNVWLGISVEDQKTADERIPLLTRTPAAVRFVSYEPALGPVDFIYPTSLWPNGPPMCCSGMECGCMGKPIDPPLIHGVDQIIIGGESGPGARPFNVGSAIATIKQCRECNVSCFVKQLGAKPIFTSGFDSSHWPPNLRWAVGGNGVTQLSLRDKKGADMREWAASLQVREFPAVSG